MATQRENSKQEWTGDASIPAINAGSLQRIADATEMMARSYREVIDERDRFKNYYESEQLRRRRAERSCIALRGVITRVKRRMKGI